MKRTYISPSILVEEMETMELLKSSQFDTKTDSASEQEHSEVQGPGTENTNTEDEGFGGSKDGNGFFWFDLGAKW